MLSVHVVDEFDGAGSFACYRIYARWAVPSAGGGYLVAVSQSRAFGASVTVRYDDLAYPLSENPVNRIAFRHTCHTDKVDLVGQSINFDLKIGIRGYHNGLSRQIYGKLTESADILGQDGTFFHVSYVAAFKMEAWDRFRRLFHHSGKIFPLHIAGNRTA